MPDFNIKNIKELAKNAFEKIKSHRFFQKRETSPSETSSKFIAFVSSWWHILLFSVFAFICLYYPIGGFIINDIDRKSYDISQPNKQQSATVEMMSFLINREVIEKNWTPNLPFFFPSYFLDNMPNFQLGIMSAVSNTANALSKKIAAPITGIEKEDHLKIAAKLLKYDGRIWMFSPQNRFTPVPSANSQYRKARKRLIKYNQDLSDGTLVFYRNPEDLAFFLRAVNKDLQKSVAALENQIREYSSNWIDSKEDDVFYYNQGKIYAYYLLLSALGQDYKDIIVNNDLYQDWTHTIKALENGSGINPLVVRNGGFNSITCPNHLNYLAFYALKSKNVNGRIAAGLEKSNIRTRQ